MVELIYVDVWVPDLPVTKAAKWFTLWGHYILKGQEARWVVDVQSQVELSAKSRECYL